MFHFTKTPSEPDWFSSNQEHIGPVTTVMKAKLWILRRCKMNQLKTLRWEKNPEIKADSTFIGSFQNAT